MKFVSSMLIFRVNSVISMSYIPCIAAVLHCFITGLSFLRYTRCNENKKKHGLLCWFFKEEKKHQTSITLYNANLETISRPSYLHNHSPNLDSLRGRRKTRLSATLTNTKGAGFRWLPHKSTSKEARSLAGGSQTKREDTHTRAE